VLSIRSSVSIRTFALRVTRMKVGRPVIVEEHRDRDPKKRLIVGTDRSSQPLR
jgi:hypothetical protein